MYDATPRESFVVALKDIPELWEISLRPQAPPIYDGLVHDYKMGEGDCEAAVCSVRAARRSTNRSTTSSSTRATAT